jgi:large subunit ribosomal protein L22
VTQYRAIHRDARITARKARLAADLVRGQSVNRALELLQYSTNRSCRLLEKVVKSALANANQDERVDVNKLVVAECRVDDGPLLGGRPRWRPSARGRAMPIRKRTCHIHVGLDATPEPVMPIQQKAPATEAKPKAHSTGAKPKAEAKPKADAKAASEAKPKAEDHPKGAAKPKSGGEPKR